MMLRRKHTQRGISLIELMLSLAIIAIILVIATRYFARANLSQQINNATDQVMGIRAAATSYLNDMSSSSAKPDLSIATLVTKGYLPKSYGGTATSETDSTPTGNGANPWNGNLSVDYSLSEGTTSTRSFEVTTTDVPAAACQPLADKITANLNEALGDKVNSSSCATDGTFSVTFSR